MAPVRSYVAVVHGQRVTVNVYAAPKPTPTPLYAKPRSKNTSVQTIDPTWKEELATKGGATERGGRCRAPAVVTDYCR